MERGEASERTIVGPTGRRYVLADDALPLADQVRHNYDVTGAYLRDVLETAIASAAPEVAPLVFGQAVSNMLRAMPVPWLREFAYAGIVRRAELLSEDAIAPLTDSDS